MDLARAHPLGHILLKLASYLALKKKKKDYRQPGVVVHLGGTWEAETGRSL